MTNDGVPIQTQPSAYPTQPVYNPGLNNIYLTNSGSVNDTNTPKKPTSRTRIILLLILVIVMLLTGYVFLIKKGVLDSQNLANISNQNPLSNSKNEPSIKVSPSISVAPKELTKAVISKKYINCAEVRKVIEDVKNRYISCEGGVIIFDKVKNEVLNVLTKYEGLPSNTTTDLLLNGMTLYIATQKGIAVYNLDTKEVKILDTSKGLASDNNITLAEEPGFVWAGTFEGISRIDKSNLKIETFTQFDGGVTKPDVKNIIIYGDYVFASLTSNITSNGGLMTYDLKSKTFKYFPPSTFTKKTNRVDFADMIIVENAITKPTIVNKLYLSTIEGTVYESRVGPVLNFTENKSFVSIDPSIKRAVTLKFLGGINTKILTSAGQDLSYFDVTTNRFIPDSSLSTNETAYKATFTDLYNSQGKDPKSFGNIIFGMDDSVIIRAGAALYKFDNSNNTLAKVIDIGSESDDFQVKKIPEKSEILIGHQECLGECAIIAIYKYNFETGKSEKLNILTTAEKDGAINVETDLTDKMVFQLTGIGQSYISINLMTLDKTLEPYTPDKYIKPQSCDLSVKPNQIRFSITPKLSEGVLKSCDGGIIANAKHFDNTFSDPFSTSLYLYSDDQSRTAYLSNGLGFSVFRLE